jgi:eukaryotic-like serine/threonine-protein kinase
VNGAATKIGRYQIVRLLGKGGMGDVYLARDPRIDRLVAVKVLKDSLNTEEYRKRFLREARAAGQLQHPNIVTVFDVHEVRGRLLIAMEYISGRSLAEIITRAEPLSLVRKLEIIEGICAGLAWAHAAKVVHRDIKPGNVMVDDTGQIKIVDFGIAKSVASEVTGRHAAIGTPAYMSPEQITQKPIDHRSDMFSTAVVAYELLTGRKPFDGNASEQVARLLSGRVPPMNRLGEPIPWALEQAIVRGLAQSPEQRFADMSAMQRELLSVRRQLTEMASRAEPHADWGRTDETLLADGTSPARASARGLATPWVARSAIIVGVGGLGLAAWLTHTRPVSSPSSATSHVSAEAKGPSLALPPKPTGARPLGERRSPQGSNADRSPARVDARIDPAPSEAPAGTGESIPPAASSLSAAAAPDPPTSAPAPPASSSLEAPSSAAKDTRLADDAEIQEALRNYQTAYESMSGASVKSIWPSISDDAARNVDRLSIDNHEHGVKLLGITITRQSESQATVRCRMNRWLVPKGGRPRRGLAGVMLQITLQKADGHWLISEIRQSPTQ